MKSTKKSLLASGLALLVCCTLLIGTTFAWFTDSVSNTGNRIQAGEFDIDLLMDLDGKGSSYAYESIADGQGDIFNENGNGYNWEPGRTEIVYLAVQNKGTLAAAFDLDVIPTAEDEANLGMVLECAVLDGMMSSDELIAQNWSELTAGLEVGDNLFEKLNNTRTVVKDAVVNAGTTKYFALAVHMKETAENNYQKASVSIDVQVKATQAPVENDAFGNTYDEGAAKYAIYTAQDLQRALAKPEDGATYTVFADNLTIPSNFSMSPARKGTSFTIDLNGHQITLAGNSGCTVTKDATLTVTDSSKEGDGAILHTGNGYMFAVNRGITFTLIDESTRCSSQGKGITINT